VARRSAIALLIDRSLPLSVLFAPLSSPSLAEDQSTCLLRKFGVNGAAELIYLVGLYCLVSVTLNGFDVPVPEPNAT
jgi:hypothetical protein